MLNRNIVSSSRQAPHRTFRAPLSRHARCPKRNAVPGTPPGPPVQWDKAEDPDDVQPGYGYVPADTAHHEDIFFYHTDHLGSTSYITDAKANVAQFDAYLPYGELLVDEHSSSEEMPYKFNGKEFDEETGLYYYGARYMNPRTGLWYGVDPLAEKYPSIYSYCYTFNNPVKIIDPDGKEPIKPQAGTAQGFVNKLNTTGTKSGTKHGKAAHDAMLGFGKMEFHFPRPLPANTGKINNYRDKYIYTTKAGWLDMAHFMFYAGKAYQYKIQKQEAKKQLEDTWGMAFLPIETQREILKRSLQEPVGEAVQAGYFQEKTDEIVAKHSAYSYEDLPSDKFGAEFGANYFNPDSKLSLGEQLYNYLEGLGATDPQNSPNYQILPSKEPNKKPSRTNRTTTPVFTKKKSIVMAVKKTYIIVSVVILTMLLFFFIKNKREKDLIQKGEDIVEKIELFRKKNHRLPKDLNEIGILEEENANALYYDVRNDTSYTVSFMMSIDYNKTYYSDTKEWENGYREMK